MNNDCVPSGKDNAEIAPFPTTTASLINYGRGVQVGKADSIQTTATVNLVLMGEPESHRSLSTDFYNLFIGFDPFGKNRFRVPLERALQSREYLSEAAAQAFPKWSEHTIEEIKRLPAIITDEYDRTAKNSQQVLLAVVTGVKPQENGVIITFQPLSAFPIQLLLENLDDFGIANMEVYRTHWTIKNIDLIDILNDAKIPIWGGLPNG